MANQVSIGRVEAEAHLRRKALWDGEFRKLLLADLAAGVVVAMRDVVLDLRDQEI